MKDHVHNAKGEHALSEIWIHHSSYCVQQSIIWKTIKKTWILHMVSHEYVYKYIDYGP
jgi:hypothetical protein